VEQALSSALHPGQLGLTDNPTAHESGQIHELIEGRGYEPLYLSPCSPCFNPSEETFSNAPDSAL
jgi:transposase